MDMDDFSFRNQLAANIFQELAGVILLDEFDDQVESRLRIQASRSLWAADLFIKRLRTKQGE